jgi:cysteine desulfurase family protein
MNRSIIYLDNAASSWPKPNEVMSSMVSYMHESGANPGRGSHQLAIKASRELFETRKSIANLFRINNPNDIFFCLNTTQALNLAIKGFVKENDHVICSNVEHNSVRRPLEYLKSNKHVEITYVPTDLYGNINLSQIKDAIKPNTKLMVLNHSSNLLGSILPIGEIGEICSKFGIIFLVDAAQTAGSIPIDVKSMGIQMLAFPGHKGLLGPQGTGGLYVDPDIHIDPIFHGGTGSQSELIEQPTIRPECYEAGTQNVVGMVGLRKGIEYVMEETVAKIQENEWNKTQRIMDGLMAINGLTVLGPKFGEPRTGIVSFNLKNTDASEVSFILDHSFKIAVRSGLHCTPLAHESVGTLHSGAVRASVGVYTTGEEIDIFIEAIKQINVK